ncbi:SixA phosphatase family protein [Aeoliella sp.]|uniref:SixA phosphatase family protein n=1 Tax=Aeoliella sp. TaxID=2795800 RepID=UPI003CCB7B57
MFLYLARHAWAGHYGDPNWPDDSERPLTDEGIDRYRRMLEKLSQSGMRPETIATSPYVRCEQTAELISEICGGRVTPLETLALGAELDELVTWTNHHAAEQVCWVGHNPDMPHLAAALLGGDNSAIRFAKGAVAAVKFYDQVEPASGELYWLATAKLLGV